MRILKGRSFNPGDKKPMEAERRIDNISFNVFKFTKRKKPEDKRRIIVVTNFSEFGCESLALMYCLPRLLHMYPDCYFIAVGWYGREYLYRHLVDEFWELKEEFQWLREYSKAFITTSINLADLEKQLPKIGQVFSGHYYGHFCLGNTCKDCKHFWGDSKYVEKCVKCGSTKVERSLFGDIPHYKKMAVPIPKPRPNVLEDLKKQYPLLIIPKMVGIFGRGRRCYGRNLPPAFYMRLIHQLKTYGFNPIWLGEKQSTISCPDPTIKDWSRMKESRDLEKTLAIVGQCDFTIQFWTASTRLASIMGVPWILFESPDQIVGKGQEGMRIALTAEENKKKIVLAHYLSVLENQNVAFDLIFRAIKEMNEDNWSDIVGMVESPEIVEAMLEKKQKWVSSDK
jgi:hypothetical protein